MRTIGLSHSAGEKLARFILDLITDHNSGKGAATAKLTLTHEEIAQMIGTSRETVTRTFAELKRKNLLIVKGSTLTIKDRSGLERLVQS
jgi:CRP/FNR family transcriptional regulator